MAETIRAQRDRRLYRIEEEARNIAAAAIRLVNEVKEAADHKTPALLQPQLGFIVGALMRLTKDAGVVEHLQALVAEARTPK